MLSVGVERLESSAEQVLDFLIRQAELAKDAQNIDWRELTNSHVDWNDTFLASNNAHVQTMIPPPFSKVAAAG